MTIDPFTLGLVWFNGYGVGVICCAVWLWRQLSTGKRVVRKDSAHD